ncbi:MAG: hypothetical protein QN187_15120 [Armatimonadota bacterium]|nr:hypothetical protein [Armatimonadota bacterium]MDR7518468.1 hypothetical protein [Armatimonadota bacterium]MDR7550562.1 hypothetical protein [Armatimonadota bacterium]
MPKEVFAEEIEEFLERLDAVAAARVVATDAGEIDRIYITTESTRDDLAIRRAITSALMSQYSLPVDGWRVQIAHLEPTPRPEPVPECHLVRLEETITETMTRVVVELRYEREGVQKTVSGSAQAPAGQAHRLRTVALATVDALRPLADRAGGRPQLEGLTVMPFAGATVVLAAVSLVGARGTLMRVGAETVSASEGEAVVGAVLDAMRKPIRPAAQPDGIRTDRRRQFEGLRRHYERLIRMEAPVPPPAPLESAPPTPEAGGTGEVRAAGEAPQPADVLQAMTEIRPEPEGGAPTAMREDIRSEGAAGVKSGPRYSMEDAFYRRLVSAGVPVHIRCRDGYEIPTAIVRDFGTYSLMVEVNGVVELVFKHGIIAIRPYGPLPPETPPS